MRISPPVGWKLWVWATTSVAWSVYYLFYARIAGQTQADATGGALQFLFNWLFPVALLYLLLTVGKREN